MEGRAIFDFGARVRPPPRSCYDATMFPTGALTFREFAMNEPLPLATIHQAVLEFLRRRDDVALFGAQAVNAYVNAYVDEPRMTQDVDVLATAAGAFAEEMRSFLAERFHIAVRVREVSAGQGFHVFQLQTPKNRHLVDVRQVSSLPATRLIADVPVLAPLELIAAKVIAYSSRRGQPKSGADWRDLASLLLAFPQYKTPSGPVRDALLAAGADDDVLSTWTELATAKISPPEDEGY